MTSVDTPPAIDAHGIARRFGARWCLRGVTLRVQPGEIVGLTGANGSGKTTFLRVVATLLRPNAGTIQVYGHDVVKNPDGARGEIGFLAHASGLYDDLSATENLQFAAAMLGRGASDIPAVLERVNLARVAHDRVRGFSAGMQRRLALARLLLVRPRLLLLDEPYANLDTAGIAMMNTVITDIRAAGGAALLVLHELAPAADVLDRLETIVDGRIAVNTHAELRNVTVAGAR